ncbi:MAG TPA: matrixin family metalloprotease [Patescibacteria group bacterium]|nr:matrixin family metalloprotease [Patescibacteria group bacterium]
MGWGKVALLIFILVVFVAFLIYWFSPVQIEFITGNTNSNFSMNSSLTGLQFYPNMRFPSTDISYGFNSSCSQKRISDMVQAFSQLSQQTNLTFSQVDNNEEITITCSNQVVPQGNGLFIAGEGGPTKVIAEDKFNVILNGEVLLLTDPSCSHPVVSMHELLHVLGFQHSLNPNNIMYPITNPNCMQTLGQDIPAVLNQVYSYPSLPDLELQNVSASMHGRYLDVNLTILNNGLADAQPSKIDIYADGNLIKELDEDGIKLGEGEIITLGDIFVTKISINQLEIVVNYNFNELEKDNNQVTLTIKK